MKLPIQLDRYTLVEAIGAGAFGRVYRAEVRSDMGFVSDFAVKVLDANVVQTNPNVAAQMADEARLLSQLDHPNIVKVIDFKHVDHFVLGDVYMMVLEFVRGVDVAEVLEHLQNSGEHIPATAVLHMGLMVADALNHAYSMTTREGEPLKLVHRDLKPHNMMVNFRGQVKILDFGIAKAKSARMAAATQEGQTKGTVFYMSPEQLAGESLDGRSDLYSLGTILFELLYGRRLLDVDVQTPADLARAMHTAFEMDIEERLSDLDKHLQTGANGPLTPEAIEGWLALLRSVLQKDARYRPDNARVFAEQLEWLRNRHAAEVVDREFWVRVVEEVAAARAARGGPRMPPTPTPRPRRVVTVDELPTSDISLSESAQDFFGMESGELAEEAPAAMAAAAVPMTRAMSTVRGSVRSFGSQQVQQISPLPDVLRNIGNDEGTVRIDDSTDSLVVPEVARDQAVDAPTVAVDVPLAANAGPSQKATTKALQEAPTQAPAPVKPKKARRPQPEPGPDKRVIALLGIAALLLVVVILALLMRGKDAPDGEVAGGEVPSEPSAALATGTEAPEPVTPAAEEPEPEVEEDEPTTPEPIEEPEDEVAEPEPAEPERSPTPRPRPEPAPKAEPAPRPTPTPAPEPEPVAAAAESGTLHLSARPRCRVYVDDVDKGTTDETRRGVVLAPGTYTVRFVCDGPECAGFEKTAGRKTLEVRAGEKARYHVDFYDLNGAR